MSSISAHLHLLHLLSIISCTFFFQIQTLTAFYTFISPTQYLTGNKTLVSPAEDYELGFFSPAGNANNYWYIGIWCRKIETPTYVWVANRDTPLNNSNGILTIRNNNLVLVDDSGKLIWSSNVSAPGGTTASTVAELLDYGNFILRRENDDDPDNYLWQSFFNPTDTLLPGMRLGWDAKTGQNRYITSWKSASDPSSGDYSFKLNVDGDPEIYLTHRNSTIYRSGPWNGVSFSGVPEMQPKSPLFTFEFVISEDEVYYSFNLTENNVYSRLLVTSSGSLQRYVWITANKVWNLYWYAPKDQCDDYRECGVYGICDTNASPVCKCLRGFVPRNPAAWNLRDGSGGCVRVGRLDCETDGFLEMGHVKMPESGAAFMDLDMDLDRCREMCKKNCSCRGFSNVNVTGTGSGCVIWAMDLYDMRQYAVAEGGQRFYLRVNAADLEQAEDSGLGHSSSGSAEKIIKIASITGGVAALFIALAVFLWKRRKSRIAQGNVLDEIRARRAKSRDQSKASTTTLRASAALSIRDNSVENVDEELDLPLFDFSTIVKATDKFSDAKKLGQGGFGCVYKGVLEDGQEIAVKRLSRNSGQGIEEFKNEVKLIARLQHRNLVRLLGCCVETEEKMLIYEYMENKSLDSHLFKKDNISSLEWQNRFRIICGIARGLLYLHQDSRFRIIHRDLKASNVLLDKGMNPKISDFGMARIFGGDQTEGETKRVVGTYGYMAPEYAMDGLFSVKSDVFSFGVLVLEIVSGMKNRGFYQTNNQLNLLAYAWRLYREGRALEVVDSACGESYSTSEVMRSIQVGLLCVQESAEDRPNMSTVVLMLSSECSSMPQPKQPGYCLGRRPVDADATSQDESCTLNQLTVTVIDGR